MSAMRRTTDHPDETELHHTCRHVAQQKMRVLSNFFDGVTTSTDGIGKTLGQEVGFRQLQVALHSRRFSHQYIS